MMLDRRRYLMSLAAGAVAVASSAWAKDSLKPAGRGMRCKPEPKKNQITLRYLRYREPRLLFVNSLESDWSQQELLRLQQPQAAFEMLQGRGWRIGTAANQHLQLINAEERPDVVGRYGAADFPWVGCLQRGRIVRVYNRRAKAPLDAWSLSWLLSGEDRRPASGESSPTVAGYPVTRSHWIVNGDHAPIQEVVLQHLETPLHRNRVPSAWDLGTWTYPELRSLHDDLHRFGRPRELASIEDVSDLPM